MQLKFIQVSPYDSFYNFQVEIQLTNLRKHGYSKDYTALVYIPFEGSHNSVPQIWRDLQKKFPEAKFYFYKDVDNECTQEFMRIGYAPLLRPWTLQKHFALFPELQSDAIFYLDADVILHRPIDFEKFLNDDICYLSYTGGRFKRGNYIGVEYLQGKEDECIPELKEELQNLDVISKMAQMGNTTKEVVLENAENTGGAQYLLKNIDSSFWGRVYNTCVEMKPFLAQTNQQYFPGDNSGDKENRGYQSFCTDMWAVLYNLWGTNRTTRTPPELDFAWATDPISKLDTVSIMHNAGVTSNIMNLNGEDEIFFHKAEWVYKNPHLHRDIINNTTSKYCTRVYADAILEVHDSVYKQ